VASAVCRAVLRGLAASSEKTSKERICMWQWRSRWHWVVMLLVEDVL